MKVVAARDARLVGLAMDVLNSRAKGRSWMKLSKCISIVINLMDLNY